MKSYRHFGHDERVKLSQLKQSGLSLKDIAQKLGRHRTSVHRELVRNAAPPGEYWPDTAQSLTRARRFRGSIIDRNEDLKDFIIEKLRCYYWTPEQVAGHLKHCQKKLPSVCFETIYGWIYHKNQRVEKLWKFLPRHKATRGLRKYKGAGKSRIPQRISIDQRPSTGKIHKIFGHWEGDLMSFKKNSQHILVLRERKTMATLSLPLMSKKSCTTAQVIESLLKDLPKKARKTLTLDNGGEFAKHWKVAENIGIKTYFCDPYASWQKGGVENTNGRLRRDLPRNTDVKNMKKEDFDEIIDNYNSTPRKKLGWLTPAQAFRKNLQRVALRT